MVETRVVMIDDLLNPTDLFSPTHFAIMKKCFFWLCLLMVSASAFAHPMPSSIVELTVLENAIKGEAKMPLIELVNAVGDERIKNLSDPFFKGYFTQHIQAITSGKKWQTKIESINLTSDKDPDVGTYQEVLVRFTLTPPDASLLRTFTFNYDVIMHQVITHSALVAVKQDWSNGIQDENAVTAGVIQLDVPSGKIYPLQVNLEQGSWWKGFRSIFHLGMQHIKEGTDHLLFLLVLLLPAMLLTDGKRWGGFGGLKYSLLRLLRIVTAFTVGHSVTLLLGALEWVRLPSQPVEILIAFSIFISAIHAIRPLFPGKEVFVAAGFGLIHGLAFATVLSHLELSAGKLALSILGFNLGIEAMQLFVVLMVVPWLILLSKRAAYQYIRIAGSILAAIAAVAWMLQRFLNQDNAVTTLVEGIAENAPWIVLSLATLSAGSLIWPKTKNTVLRNAFASESDKVSEL